MRAAHVPLLSLTLVLAACGGKDPETDTTGTDATGPEVTGTEVTGTGVTGTDATDTTSTIPTSTDATSTDATSDDPDATSTGTTGTPDDTTSTTGDPPSPLTCPPSIDAAILACIADLQADPELGDNNFLLDLLLMCSDAEPVADDYDTHCADNPRDPICALEYPEFVETVLPACIARAQEIVFADVCLLPATYPELLFTPAIALMQRRLVTSADQLDASEQSQLLWASNDMGFPAATVDEALFATDDKQFEQLTVLDVGTDRTLVAFTAHYGDTQVGRVFFRGTLTLVGAIEDGAFTRCGVERTIEGQPCQDDMTCAPDHDCLDILTDMNQAVLAPGTCISPAPIPGEGEPCSGHADCDPGTGLLCLDTIIEGEPGTCRPGWMRRSFPAPDGALVAGGSLEIPILVSGLATVPTGAYLDLQLVQDAANELEIRIINPLGTSTLVSASAAKLIELDLTPLPVPGDESAGGVWKLVIDDLGGKASGVVTHLALTLDTRWD